MSTGMGPKVLKADLVCTGTACLQHTSKGSHQPATPGLSTAIAVVATAEIMNNVDPAS